MPDISTTSIPPEPFASNGVVKEQRELMSPLSANSSIEEVHHHQLAIFAHQRNRTGTLDAERDWTDQPEANLLWRRLSVPEGNDVEALMASLVRHAVTTVGRTHFNLDAFAGYQAAAHTVRDRLLKRWNETQQHQTQQGVKRVYYLSLEFLMGRSLDNSILALGLKGPLADALRKLGMDCEDLIEQEQDAALGNGGLGRLAACFMDSLATMNYAGWGYGLRYTYGIFKQLIKDGRQVEVPDYWLTFDNPWEIPRLDVVYEVRFYGQVGQRKSSNGVRAVWTGGEKVLAVAYDVPVPGFGTENCGNIRLWSSKPKKQFDLQSFNAGNYQQAVDQQHRAEQITSVLYPNDNTMAGKELRLKQQYFFVAATLQDIIRRFKKTARPWSEFPDQVAIQLNDTHPTLGIIELQRVLVDLEGLHWDAAWNIVRQTYAFTNHTVLPEAMERWSMPMLQTLLPRHALLILEANLYFLQAVERRFPNDRNRLARMSLIEEGPVQFVRMAHLAIIGSHQVNGVAAIHSSLIRTTVFKDFVDFFGEGKFCNKTNGITPRRWLRQANPELASLITERVFGGSEAWLCHLERMQEIERFAEDEDFLSAWMRVKRANKDRLARLIADRCGVLVSPDALFDVQVKRIHEYKRQLMNILHVVHRFLLIERGALHAGNCPPRAVVFGGKAAPGYYMAKLVIKLISDVAALVNAANTPLLKVVFIPDYNVSLAETIVPASDVSEHISTAGTEASGTSNMKFVLNGGLIIGTLDGANIEILEACGPQSCFVFGAEASQVDDIRHSQRYRGMVLNEQLQEVIDVIRSNRFGNAEEVAPLLDSLTSTGGDYYLLSHDFASYLDAQRKVDTAFRQHPREWAQASVRSAARMGRFSSDRSIKEYAEDIWHIKPCPVPRQQ